MAFPPHQLISHGIGDGLRAAIGKYERACDVNHTPAALGEYLLFQITNSFVRRRRFTHGDSKTAAASHSDTDGTASVHEPSGD